MNINISIRQVSSDAATLQRCTCGLPLLAVAAAITPALLLLQVMLLL